MPRGDHWKHWTERLQEGATLDPDTGCIIWQKSTNSRGYGVIYFNKKLHLAHRAAWLAEHGTWPNPEMVTDHICENKRCVNVDHLRELPNHLNLRRAIPRGDEETERRRARQRRASAKHRGTYRYVEGGEENSLVQGG